MKHKTITFQMALLDADGISVSQKPAAGGVQNLTITGVLATGGVATLDVPRHVSIYSSGNESSASFVVTGTDRYGDALTETITGPGASATVKGSKNFKTVTSVTISTDAAGNVTVGSADEAEGVLYPVDYYTEIITFRGVVNSGGDFTHSLKYTLDEVQNSSFDEYSADFTDIWTETTITTGQKITSPIRAVRLAITNWTSATDSLVLNIVPTRHE